MLFLIRVRDSNVITFSCLSLTLYWLIYITFWLPTLIWNPDPMWLHCTCTGTVPISQNRTGILIQIPDQFRTHLWD